MRENLQAKRSDNIPYAMFYLHMVFVLNDVEPHTTLPIVVSTTAGL